jgi:hypothetical protein
MLPSVLSRNFWMLKTYNFKKLSKKWINIFFLASFIPHTFCWDLITVIFYFSLIFPRKSTFFWTLYYEHVSNESPEFVAHAYYVLVESSVTTDFYSFYWGCYLHQFMEWNRKIAILFSIVICSLRLNVSSTPNKRSRNLL